MKRYNGLNSVKIDLAACGICNACGRRFTDPLCKHGTTEQVEFTRQLDAKIEAEYEQKRQAREIAKDNDWLVELHNTRDLVKVVVNQLASVRYGVWNYLTPEQIEAQEVSDKFDIEKIDPIEF